MPNQESAITILPVPWKSVVRYKVAAHLSPYFDTCSFSFIVSLPSYNLSLTASASWSFSDRSWFSFDFYFLFQVATIRFNHTFVKCIIIFPGVRAWSKLSLTAAERNSMICLSLSGSNENWRNHRGYFQTCDVTCIWKSSYLEIGLNQIVMYPNTCVDLAF